MKRVYVNEEWCLGCHLCEYHCAFANAGGANMVKALKGKQLASRIKVEEQGDVCFAVSCRHCEEPLCVKSCISGAASVRDGIVVFDPDRCVGCYTCVLVCPYGAVVPTEQGVMRKCELCIERAEGQPACVAGCPNKAIVFEERDA
ncbi:MAG: 4Fe-4S binding protein [Oscillospiraceae bacterium]|jgi:carbon-monoxide dehydrogenase iron sulfur subunit|nr:4Fe-4S binding protein [Oscillospiraceae bacterium]